MKTIPVFSSARLITLLIVLTIATPLSTSAGEPGLQNSRPKIALVLSGGGARGLAHIGVLKVLEDLRVPIDMIVGTSMGSIAGGLYANGYSPAQLEEMVLETPWDTLFSNEISRAELPYRKKPDEKNYFVNLGLDYKQGLIMPKALIPAKKFEFRLRAWTAGAPDDFERFRIPFMAVATDIETGRTVVLLHGDLAKSLRASMAVPGVFMPVEIDGKVLVDGGVSDQLPVDVAKKMGADIIIAVNVGTPLKKASEINSIIDVTDQLSRILTNRTVFDAKDLLGKDDILIVPDLKGFTNMDFSKTTQEIERGEQAALSLRDSLARYSVAEDVYSRYIENQRRPAEKPFEFIEVETPFGNFKEDLNIKSSDIQTIIDTRLVNSRIFKNREFRTVDFSVVEEDGRKGLLLKSETTEWEPDVLKFGFEAEDDIEGNDNFNVLIGYTMNSINRFGADWKNEAQFGLTNRFFTEFYQPFSPKLWTPFIAPWFEAKNTSVYIYDETQKIAEYRTREITGEIDLGFQFGRFGEIRLGVGRGSYHITPKIAPFDWPDEQIADAGYSGKLVIDTIDNLNFPRYGLYFEADGFLSDTNLGADYSYGMYQGKIAVPLTFGKSTIMPLVKGGSCRSLDTELDGVVFFSLGGFQNLSGMYPDQIQGNQMLFGELQYFYRIWHLPKMIGKNIYLGLTAEAGNVWNDPEDSSLNDLIGAGSLFLGLETLIGPIYLAYGRAEGNQGAFYFYLGHMF
jgi:NTE family protein